MQVSHLGLCWWPNGWSRTQPGPEALMFHQSIHPSMQRLSAFLLYGLVLVELAAPNKAHT
jgi:hypothetical protein